MKIQIELEIKDVTSFLNKIDEGIALKAFQEAITSYRRKPADEALQDVLICGDEEEAISRSFVWHKTPEGWEYWNLVAHLWRKHLAELKAKVEVN